MDKSAVIDAFVALVLAELASIEKTTQSARDEATSAESRPENKYDTRATEASYLAAGLGERLLAVRKLAAWLQTEQGEASPLITLEGERELRYLLVPDGGGRRIRLAGGEVVAVSADSPVGSLLAGCNEGDEVKIGPVGAQRPYEVVRVA